VQHAGSPASSSSTSPGPALPGLVFNRTLVLLGPPHTGLGMAPGQDGAQPSDMQPVHLDLGMTATPLLSVTSGSGTNNASLVISNMVGAGTAQPLQCKWCSRMLPAHRV
jgi:hypothetical protein